MMPRERSLPKLVLVLLIALFLGACSDVIEIEDEEYEETDSVGKTRLTIAMVPKFGGTPYFTIAKRGAENAARDLDVDLIFQGPGVADAAQQEAIIEELIEKRVDALCVSCNDPAALTGVLTKARREGIRVITWDSDSEKEVRELFILGVDPEQMGRHVMDYLAKYMDYSGKFAIVSGAVTSSTVNEWIYWTKKQLEEKYKEIELVTVVPSEDNMEKAYMQAKNILQTYPDIKGIIGYCDTAGPGVARAVQEAGLNGKVKVVAASMPNSIARFLKSNACQASVLYDIEKMGYLTVAVAVKLVTEDKMPEDGEDIPTVGKIRLIEGRTVVLGDPMDFTVVNVDKFKY